MQNDERLYAPPAGASDSPAPPPASARGPDEAEAPPSRREAYASEWEDTAMDAPCL